MFSRSYNLSLQNQWVWCIFVYYLLSAELLIVQRLFFRMFVYGVKTSWLNGWNYLYHIHRPTSQNFTTSYIWDYVPHSFSRCIGYVIDCCNILAIAWKRLNTFWINDWLTRSCFNFLGLFPNFWRVSPATSRLRHTSISLPLPISSFS